MPWHKEAMKDVITYDMLRWGGNNLEPADFRMGQPLPSNVGRLSTESIGWLEQTQGIETSQYLVEDKTIVISWVVASEMESV